MVDEYCMQGVMRRAHAILASLHASRGAIARGILSSASALFIVVSYDSFAIGGLGSGGGGGGGCAATGSDLDGDGSADAAMPESPGGKTAAVLNMNSSPVKTLLSIPALAASVTMLPSECSRVVAAVKVGSNFEWKKHDFLNDSTATFATTPAKGVPVVGCYRNSEVHTALFGTANGKSTLKLTGSSNSTLALPSGTRIVHCGSPVDGVSRVFVLVKLGSSYSVKWNSAPGAPSGKANLPSRPKKFTPSGIGSLPRASEQPVPFSFGREGAAQALYVLGSGGKWQSLSLSGVPPGAKIVDGRGILIGSSNLVLLQIKSGNTFTYKTVTVPANILGG